MFKQKAVVTNQGVIIDKH